jgi:PAS domain S-box-containing protein
MPFKGGSIQQKLMRIIVLTSGAVLLLTCASYFVYEYLTFRQGMIRQLNILGETIATNSTAALAFENSDDADEILTALKADKHIVGACLYNKEGKLFSSYPLNLPSHTFPLSPSVEGYHFVNSHLEGFQAVMQGTKQLGTLYIKSDLGAMYERFRLYAIIAILVIALSFLLSYLLSRRLQRRITKPIVALTETARAIAKRGDYSVRATKLGDDEFGLLTDAINHMLTQIEKQNLAITSFNQHLEQKVKERTDELENNIKQLNESQEQLSKTTDLFSKLFNYNPGAIAITQLDDAKIINVNDAFLSFFGFANREEVIGKTAKELDIVGSLEQREEIAQLLKKNNVVKDFEIKTHTRQGKEFWVSTSILIIEIEGRQCMFSISIDITNRKETEDQVTAANKELEAFSYSVSHDLRAPLRSIHSYINILYEEYAEKFDEEAKRLINIVINNSRKMGQLIDDLLAFSRLGRRELVKANINMDSLVKGICDEQKKIQEANNLEIIISKLPDSLADSTAITQVWTNLISNALKYSRNKERPVVEIGHFKKENATVYYVRDNGAGFDMKYYDKLFGVFQRLHSSKEFEGTGVGLAIVQRIIYKHGGTVWAESKVNEGTTFYFSLNGEI